MKTAHGLDSAREGPRGFPPRLADPWAVIRNWDASNAHQRNILLRLFCLYNSHKTGVPIGVGSYSPFVQGSQGLCTYTVWHFCCVGDFWRCYYGIYSCFPFAFRMSEARRY